ncbi:MULTISPECIES: acyl-CoA dehydrogenase family protein [Streptomyces]|uniref:Acyl-CoA dehydrogenase family protein n=1 Tax=Streptomyces eurythermus TaxID=42237 RepID=A0ABW6Z5D9_9ACTN|nr:MULTISPECIES: acyl-CoA dehydrogenase family protein [Streptomyces]QIS75151.1 acyl-CoA dehydrogenase family protein [Streptomyces sp. DSM 40868]
MPTTPPPPALQPYLTSRHTALWHEADTVAAKDIAPRVLRMETAPHNVERHVSGTFAKRGWFAVTVPEEFGGMGAGHVAKTILIHRVALVSAAAGAILQATLIPVGALLNWGTDTQKKHWLPQVAKGTLLLSIATTEPAAGGHIGGIETTADRCGDEWVITGSKTHIGNAHLAGAHLVIARTAKPGVPPSGALTAFLVESHRKGLKLAGHQLKVGLHGFSAGRLDLDQVRVPDENRIGEVGRGLDVAMSSSILYGRANLAAVSLGVHEKVVETTASFLKGRPRYGGSLSDHPVVRDRLGEMESRLRAARNLAYHAVYLRDLGLSCDAELINSKHLGHSYGVRSAQEAMELHGAHGLSADYPLQRLWRDAQCTYPPAGTGEVQRIQLAHAALDEEPIQWSERLPPEPAWTATSRSPA